MMEISGTAITMIDPELSKYHNKPVPPHDTKKGTVFL